MLAPAIADIDRVAGRVKSARNGAGWTKDWWPRAMRKASRRAAKAAMRMGGRPWPMYGTTRGTLAGMRSSTF